jgi:hypothetical protein
MALAPYVMLYAVLSFAVYFAMIGFGRVAASNGHYYQSTPNSRARWLGRHSNRNIEWEIPLAKYKRIRGFELRGWSAFVFLFYFLPFALFALPEKPSKAQRGEAAA